MKNTIYAKRFFGNFPYDDNFQLENFLLKTIIKDFSH